MCLAAGTLLSFPAFADELAFHDAWVAAAPATATTQVAYICFVNNNDKDVEITGVSAKGFGSAMLHISMQHGDMSVMHMLSTLTVAAHKMVTLEPGGMHIMLMEPVKIATPGEKVPVTVHYKDGSEQIFELEVKTATDATAIDHASQGEHHH